jgi:nitrite reductase/ring-hydroxylating ferredoxin subunit
MQRETQPAEANRWIVVAGLDELPQEGAIERTVEGQLIAIFRHQGVLFAIEGLCAHHGGPLSQGQVANGCVTCPWHGWQYRLSDGTQLTSGVPLLASYPVREQAGQIEIGLP